MLKIITKVLRLSNSSIKPDVSRDIESVSKREQLSKLSESVNIKLTPSIIDTDEESPKPHITHQNKVQMGLFIPKSPFNHRLSKRQEKNYLPTLTKDLYLQQRQHLPSYLRILQNNVFLQDSRVTLDHYINLIYKDVYARYLISKGVGVEWKGFYADVGVTNEFDTQQYLKDSEKTENYSILLDFLQHHCSHLKKSKTMGLYDYLQRRFIPSSSIQIDRIKKMGYYIREELTEYGNFKDEFEVLKEKNSKVFILVFVEHLEKLVNHNAVSINVDEDFYILKRFGDKSTHQAQYLMLSKDIYNNHQKYFKENRYQKHSLFNSKYLIGMKARNKPLVSEIEGYEREPGAYIVNSALHLSDFQRANHHELPHPENPVDQNGKIWLKGKCTGILINDIKSTKLLEQRLKDHGYDFMDFFDVFDDEIYYQKQTNRVLKFRLGDRYAIELPYNSSSLILEGLKREGTIIAESKVQIPKVIQGRKPRDRRASRKEKKQMSKQLTEHYTLQQSLQTINNITVSSLSPSLYKIYLFLKEDEVVPYDALLSEEELNKLAQNCILDHLTINRLEGQGYTVVLVNANDNLTKSLIYLKNLTSSKDIVNIIIQPQSQTEELIPNALHLNYLINKGKSSRRKIQKAIRSNINLIKLHPTFEQQTRNLDVMTIIQGVVKSNQKQQYGMGFQALRLWTAKNDNYLGDRVINQTQINKELKHGQSIRKIFWQLLSLLPENATPVTPKLYINRFLLDSIDCYIHHMQECYKYMNLHKAYALTLDFFENILEQIYVKSIRKRIINYPNYQQNLEHFVVIRRVMELVAVISPLFPFSAFHVSRNNLLKWPQISSQTFYEGLKLHNQMIRLRVKVINKLRLNRLTHAQLHTQTLKDQFSERDLQLFFNLDKVTIKKPADYDRQCSLRLPKHNSMTADQKLTFYISEDHCLRCDSHSKQADHFCSTCLEYMQEQIGEPYKYFKIENRGDIL